MELCYPVAWLGQFAGEGCSIISCKLSLDEGEVVHGQKGEIVGDNKPFPTKKAESVPS